MAPAVPWPVVGLPDWPLTLELGVELVLLWPLVLGVVAVPDWPAAPDCSGIGAGCALLGAVEPGWAVP